MTEHDDDVLFVNLLLQPLQFKVTLKDPTDPTYWRVRSK